MTKLKSGVMVVLAMLVASCSISVSDFMGMTKFVMSRPLVLPKLASGPAWSEEEIECLTLTIYGEARNQPFHGQVAVGAVVVSRSLSPNWPKNLCDVVREKGQFAGYWAALEGGVKEKGAWDSAKRAADFATSGYPYLSEQYRKVFFFTRRKEVSPFHNKMELVGYIMDHAFYSENKK